MAEKKIIAVMGATGAQGGGLVRAILEDADGPFAARAITRKPDSDKARALAAAGAEVVAGDSDDPASLEAAFAGAHGVFCVTNFWEHTSAERELAQATAMARATKKAGVAHVVWSTLEDTRTAIPLDDPQMPVLRGKYNVPHFDAKGEADAVFKAEAAPTSYLLAAFYWDNFIYFGMAPRKGEDGKYVLSLPLGGAKLPGIGAGDIGPCAYGVFQRGSDAIRQRFGIAGEILDGEQMAAAFSKAWGEPVGFFDVPFDVYRGLGFPGADDLGNMFQYQAILGDAFYASRDPQRTRALYPGVLDFDAWLARNVAAIPKG
ncbi:MAG: NmrA/HSCARG family protein [Acidobacteria bacterium]|nr:NmrA/HSCARG family protein [Acidobacteriota bacterium]MCB9378231.1 NmrA/HSCARG family protein [Holophagales bacterium]